MCRKESSKERDFKELIKIRNFAEFWLGMYKFHKSVCFYNYSDSIFLGDTLADLGFEMDSGKSYYEKFGETHLPDIDELQHYMPEMDIQLLGNLIFSQWRRWNHWSDYEIMEEKDFQWFVIAFERLADLATERYED